VLRTPAEEPAKKDEEIVADRPQFNAEERKSRERAAKAVGAKGRNVSKAKRIREKAPDLAEKVKAGTIALDGAERELYEPVRAVRRVATPFPSIKFRPIGRNEPVRAVRRVATGSRRALPARQPAAISGRRVAIGGEQPVLTGIVLPARERASPSNSPSTPTRLNTSRKKQTPARTYRIRLPKWRCELGERLANF
jgi:hypothetical protein